jgi:hypothetical protein
VIDHAVPYVLKRGINRTYVSVEPFHMFRYLDEQAYRYIYRKDENGELLEDFDPSKQAMSRSSVSGLPGTLSPESRMIRKRALTENEGKRQKRGKRC